MRRYKFTERSALGHGYIKNRISRKLRSNSCTQCALFLRLLVVCPADEQGTWITCLFGTINTKFSNWFSNWTASSDFASRCWYRWKILRHVFNLWVICVIKGWGLCKMFVIISTMRHHICLLQPSLIPCLGSNGKPAKKWIGWSNSQT